MSVTTGPVAPAAGTVAPNLTAHGDPPLRGREAGGPPVPVPAPVPGVTAARSRDRAPRVPPPVDRFPVAAVHGEPR
ncbi:MULTISPECIES: hypothetical protein [Streptomyces]|uniref:Uncharacterized protein n=1 Tax=Streptomyces rochei TaxID=1928 RepID=A0ABW7ECH3_STRRO|nr:MULTISPECIES: hypothetical protein [Streptomyces]MBQ0878783.1 hypothetical protein [Streptomyces sp. RT42]MDI3098231.1 hypothetical protein [Streptomyces sp. AN-3]RSS13136.1 hypothetical protein EF914_33200 [Streptomyces sp. WAC05458]RSS87963.1 hypothetical protein EF919_32440 [Streptomyces sp. WAC02707]WMI55854.1 hypothetical protein RBH85_02890 [Streptomyces rochei]